MSIVVCGLSHKTVPLPTLEQVAFAPHTLPKALAQLMDHDPVHEGVILSTCNRTEIYATVHRFHPAVEAAKRFLSDVSGVAADVISDGMYTYHDTSAVRHLFNVASGVDSMVVGEPQILGQVREAYRVAHEESTARRMMSALFQRALRVGKRARTETAIARHVVSLPQAAARLASELSGGLEDRTVLVIGAGRMGELAARAAADGGSTSLVIANRTFDKAEELASILEARSAELDDLPSLLREADVVLAVTAAEEPVIDRSMLQSAAAGRDRDLVAIDLGVPRNIEPSAREVPSVVLRDIAEVGEVVERGAQARRAELPKVSSIVDEEVDSFCAWERSSALGPSIAELQAWAERIRAHEVSKLVTKHGLDGVAQDELDRATRAIVNKLLHRPISQVKDLVRGKDGQVYLEAFQELFDLGTEGD